MSGPQQLALAGGVVLLIAVAAIGVALFRHVPSATVHLSPSPSAISTPSASPSVQTSATPSAAKSAAPSASTTARSAAIGIDVSDLTFVDISHGWALGTSSCTPEGSCNLAVRWTDDGGGSWYSLSAPRVLTDDRSGWHVLFDSVQDGWIFGPRLYMTHDGGSTWSDTGVPNRTLSLAANGSSVWAIEEATNCSGGVCQPALYQSGDGGRSWTHAPAQPSMIGPNAQVLRDRGSAWVLSWGSTPSGSMDSSLSASSDNGSSWHNRVRPCAPQTSAADVATEAQGQLWIVCGGPPGAGNQFKQVIASSDGGLHWTYPANPPAAGYVQQLALQPAGVSNVNLWMAAARAQLEELAAFSTGWSSASSHGLNANPGGSGVIRVIFVDSQHGWAATNDTVYRTIDGGSHWSIS